MKLEKIRELDWHEPDAVTLYKADQPITFQYSYRQDKDDYTEWLVEHQGQLYPADELGVILSYYALEIEV